MQTVILEQPGRFRLESTPEPGELQAGMALVHIHRVGICGTDIHAYRGRQPFFTYPRILGHELGVEIVAIGENEQGLRVGDRCAIEPYLNCQKCIACRRGRPNCCTSLQTLGVHTDGGMREYIMIPIRKLHRSNTLSFEQLALVETLGIGAHAVDRSGVEAGEWALVIGAGPIGLSVMQFAHLAGAKVIGLDISEERLAFAQKQGTVDVVVSGRSNPLERIQAITDGDLPTVVFDATGNQASMHTAFSYVAHTGKLIFVGLILGDITFNDPEFHRRELTLYATRNATPQNFTRIISLIEEGKIDTNPWITHRANCAELVEVFPNWLQPDSGIVKGMLTF